MSSAETQIRAWPVPTGQPPGVLSDIVAEHAASVRALEGAGQVLSIDEDVTRDGINEYQDTIVLLHDTGLNVFARNLPGEDLPASIEWWWPADGEPQRRRFDPVEGRIVVGRDDIEAAALTAGGCPCGPLAPDALDDTLLAGIVRGLLAEPELPAGLLSRDMDSRLLEYTNPGAAELSRYRGALAGFYTPAKVEHTLGLVSSELRLRLCCVWAYVDKDGPAGSPVIIAVLDGHARQLPAGLHALLVEGKGDGLIDGAAVPDGEHPLIDWQALPGYRSEDGHNRAPSAACAHGPFARRGAAARSAGGDAASLRVLQRRCARRH
jgi:hypothetical protein